MMGRETVEFESCEVIIREVIAEGGFSTVYRAEDNKKTELALKKLVCQEDSQARPYLLQWSCSYVAFVPGGVSEERDRANEESAAPQW